MKCGASEGVTNDGTDCVGCGTATSTNGECICTTGQIFVDRNFDGTVKTPGECVGCDNARIDYKGKCQTCLSDVLLSASGVADTCDCDNKLTENGQNVCYVTSNSKLNAETASSTVRRGSKTIESLLISSNMKSAFKNCGESSNWTACDELANFCALQLQGQNSACSLLANAKILNSANPNFFDRVDPDSATVSQMKISREISKVYSFSDTLGIFAAVYSKNGDYLGEANAESGFLQLCRFPELHLRAAWLFAAPHERSCSVTFGFLNDLPETQFYELFLKFTDDTGEQKSYPIITELSCDETCQERASYLPNSKLLF